MLIKTCRICGNQLPIGSNRATKYCSEPCKKLAANEHTRRCRKKSKAMTDKQIEEIAADIMKDPYKPEWKKDYKQPPLHPNISPNFTGKLINYKGK